MEKHYRTDDALMYIGYSGGPVAVPGTYQVRLSHGDFSATTQFELLKDPRVAMTIADYQEQFDLLIQIRDPFNTLVREKGVLPVIVGR